jgi:predicted XRE-type DNA-binding protein
MLSLDAATVQALRRDVAHQVARRAKCSGLTQVAAAKLLDIPQPTLSKIINGRVSDLSLELLIRIALRAGLPMTLQTGRVPEEAGAFLVRAAQREDRAQVSDSSDVARETVRSSEQRFTPAQRLEAFLEHNQLLGELHSAGRQAERGQARSAQPS